MQYQDAALGGSTRRQYDEFCLEHANRESKEIRWRERGNAAKREENEANRNGEYGEERAASGAETSQEKQKLHENENTQKRKTPELQEKNVGLIAKQIIEGGFNLKGGG
eukprot:730319-Rhodomonas_salina.3